MDMLRLGGNAMQMGAGQAAMGDMPMNDTAETVYISSLALLKMLKHGRAGVPMEVMGLMLGQFVDDFTVNVVDVFAMPQSGTVRASLCDEVVIIFFLQGVSVEAVDPVFQAKMLDMLTQTGRPEMVVGWCVKRVFYPFWKISLPFWQVSLSSGFRLLVVGRRYQHAAVVRGAFRAGSCGCR